LVKIDVEGYEPEIIIAMEPLLQRKAIKVILLDYHKEILAKRGIEPKETHSRLLRWGYNCNGNATASGYSIYKADTC
jgi:hypothetical protein